MGKLINKNCIVFDIRGEKKDVIHRLAVELGKAGTITDTEEFYKDVLAREAISPTFVGFDMGLPPRQDRPRAGGQRVLRPHRGAGGLE